MERIRHETFKGYGNVKSHKTVSRSGQTVRAPGRRSKTHGKSCFFANVGGNRAARNAKNHARNISTGTKRSRVRAENTPEASQCSKVRKIYRQVDHSRRNHTRTSCSGISLFGQARSASVPRDEVTPPTVPPLKVSDRHFKQACQLLNRGQKRAIHAVFKRYTSTHTTVVCGQPGSGKSTLANALVSLWKKSFDPNVYFVSWTGPATINLKEAAGGEGMALTIKAVEQHQDRLNLPDTKSDPDAWVKRRRILVVCDEWTMCPASAETQGGKSPWDTFRFCFRGCTVVALGDADQMAPGVIDERVKPLWAPNTSLTNMMEHDLHCSVDERKASYVFLETQERMSLAGDAESNMFKRAISDISCCRNEKMAWNNIAEFCDMLEARSSAKSLRLPNTIVAVDRVKRALRLNNEAVVKSLKDYDTVYDLRQPSKTSPKLESVLIAKGGKAHVRHNQINDAWRQNQSQKTYDVTNHACVSVLHIAEAPIECKCTLPKVPPTITLKHVHVTPDTLVEIRTKEGDRVDLDPIKVPRAPKKTACVALTGIANPDFRTIALLQGKTIPEKPDEGTSAFVISMEHWDKVTREELYMLLTRARDPTSIKIYPKAGPARLREILCTVSKREKIRAGFKKMFLSLAGKDELEKN